MTKIRSKLLIITLVLVVAFSGAILVITETQRNKVEPLVTSTSINTTTAITTTATLSSAAPPNMISPYDAMNVAAQSKGWSTTQLASYRIFTELRYLKLNGDWLEIYTADAMTGALLKQEQTLSLVIPDPVVKLRGYYWFISVNTNPTVPVQEVGHYSYLFWIDAVNATIAHKTSPR